MKKNIVIVHYNTPHVTECLVKSINLFVEDANIYIFDNSDKLPFTAKFDNVTIIDNTKGQIINFDEWLENYPNRNKSVHALNNKFGSAKHSYTIEKCIELIDDGFLLLDSDVLLKKDCSDFFREDCVYVGESKFQGGYYSHHRVEPFICFINSKMCREHDIHYFNEDYMLGLNKTKEGDRYDTGAYFYLQTKDFNKKEVKGSDYIVHYGAASYVNTARYKHRFTVNEWLERNKKYWYKKELVKKNKVVYTCIVGGYDTLKNPTFVSEDFDYVCFTDDTNIKSNIWDIRPLPKETDELPQIKKQRYVKINPHLLLSDYEISIWVDGNVSLTSNLNTFLDKYLKDDVSVYVPKHPVRNCIYSEARAVLSLKKDTKENVDKQMNRYKKEGFPEKFGLLQSNILLRRHNNSDCIKLMEAWFNELKDNSHRDQLSFNYALWKNKDVKVTYLDKFIYKSKWFNWNGRHSRNDKRGGISTETKNKPTKTIAQARKEFREIINKTRRVSTYKVPIYY